jgi:hypothetical protein
MEAMLSHRPFRRQLGQEQALAQLQQYRAAFTTAVVDACHYLTEHGYQLPDIKEKLSMDARSTQMPLCLHPAGRHPAIAGPGGHQGYPLHASSPATSVLPMIWVCHRRHCRQDRPRFFPPAGASYQADDQKVIASGVAMVLQEPYMLDGQHCWLETSKSPIFDADGLCIGLTAIFKDITQQKQDHDEMQRRAWALQANSRTNQALVQASDERELLQAVCDAIVADQRYPLALICGMRCAATAAADTGRRRQCHAYSQPAGNQLG